MRRTLHCALALTLFSTISAWAAPDARDIDGRATEVSETMAGDPLFYSCSTGDPAALMVAVAAIGLLASKRRREPRER